MRQKTPLLSILMTAILGLAACSPVQAIEGQIYMAGPDGAKVTTVINMTRLVTCDVPAATLSFGERKTYFEISLGSQGADRILLTEVAQTGPGCSLGGLYDFIRKDPKDTGWTPIEPEALEQAKDLLCAKPDLREFNPKLDGACNDWGRTK